MKNLILMGVPEYYRFPFDHPSGMAIDLYDNEICPFHRVSEDTIIVFIKSPNPKYGSVLISLSSTAFNDGYVELT